jgi:hypothetical protein
MVHYRKAAGIGSPVGSASLSRLWMAPGVAEQRGRVVRQLDDG